MEQNYLENEFFISFTNKLAVSRGYAPTDGKTAHPVVVKDLDRLDFILLCQRQTVTQTERFIAQHAHRRKEEFEQYVKNGWLKRDEKTSVLRIAQIPCDPVELRRLEAALKDFTPKYYYAKKTSNQPKSTIPQEIEPTSSSKVLPIKNIEVKKGVRESKRTSAKPELQKKFSNLYLK